MLQSGFVAIFIVGGLYGVLHSLLAAHTLKAWAEKHWGRQAQRFYRLAYISISGLLLLPMLGLVLALPDARLYAIPAPWVLLTMALQVAALWALTRAVGHTDTWSFLGLRQINQPEPLLPVLGSSNRLVTGGLYRYVRHPIYSFSFILLWLLPVMTWNLLALVSVLSIYMLIGIWFEERKLVAEFGAQYEDYRRRTRMLIPWIL